MNLQVDQAQFNKLLKNIDKKSDEIQTGVIRALEISANNIRNDASKRVPTDTGRLKTSINIRRPDKFSREIFTPVDYAPYVEFGTGAFASKYLADKSSEMRNYAMQFYVNGKGRMPANPFLFPAFENERKKAINRIKEALNGR